MPLSLSYCCKRVESSTRLQPAPIYAIIKSLLSALYTHTPHKVRFNLGWPMFAKSIEPEIYLLHFHLYLRMLYAMLCYVVHTSIRREENEAYKYKKKKKKTQLFSFQFATVQIR